MSVLILYAEGAHGVEPYIGIADICAQIVEKLPEGRLVKVHDDSLGNEQYAAARMSCPDFPHPPGVEHGRGYVAFTRSFGDEASTQAYGVRQVETVEYGVGCICLCPLASCIETTPDIDHYGVGVLAGKIPDQIVEETASDGAPDLAHLCRVEF